MNVQASRRALFGAAATVPLAGFATAPHPDAALIAACQEHARRFAEINFNETDERDCQDRPAWAPYMAACSVIESTPATTLAGAMAKASAAKLEAWGPDGEHVDGVSEQWAWNLVQELAKLGRTGGRES